MQTLEKWRHTAVQYTTDIIANIQSYVDETSNVKKFENHQISPSLRAQYFSPNDMNKLDIFKQIFSSK